KTETVGKSQKRNKSKGKESAKEVVEEENGSGSESELDSEDEQELMRAIDKEMVDGQEAEGDDTLAEDEEVEELEKDKIILDKNIKAIVEKKLSKTKNRNDGRGIIYLGRIPHGFYEKQMKQYFSQFGKITRLRLSRNKITGRPKHYAFIEFQQKEVAEIVAETMNNYLLYNRLLKCQLLAPEQYKGKNLFKGANKKYKPVDWHKINSIRHSRQKTPEQLEKLRKRAIGKQKKLQNKLKDLEIDYELPVEN
ncbi:putative RNA-binding protein, partial [Zancudomyces culisetae]